MYLKCRSLNYNYPDTLIASTMWGTIHISYYADGIWDIRNVQCLIKEQRVSK